MANPFIAPALIGAGGALAGSLLGGGGSSSQPNYQFTREYEQNKYGWWFNQLQKWGLNPLAASGMVSSPGSSPPIASFEESNEPKANYMRALGQDISRIAHHNAERKQRIEIATMNAALEREKLGVEKEKVDLMRSLSGVPREEGLFNYPVEYFMNLPGSIGRKMKEKRDPPPPLRRDSQWKTLH